jgi:hypothetical protein
MMEAATTSETSVNFFQTTRRNIPEDSHLHTRRRDNLVSYLVNNIFTTAIACISTAVGYNVDCEALHTGSGNSLQGCKAESLTILCTGSTEVIALSLCVALKCLLIMRLDALFYSVTELIAWLDTEKRAQCHGLYFTDSWSISDQ